MLELGLRAPMGTAVCERICKPAGYQPLGAASGQPFKNGLWRVSTIAYMVKQRTQSREGLRRVK